MHKKRLTQVEDEARDLRGAVQTMYHRVYPTNVEEGETSEGEHRETVPPVPSEEATCVERSSTAASREQARGPDQRSENPTPVFINKRGSLVEP